MKAARGAGADVEGEKGGGLLSSRPASLVGWWFDEDGSFEWEGDTESSSGVEVGWYCLMGCRGNNKRSVVKMRRK